MDDAEFDAALIAACFAQAADRGWTRMTVASAANAAGLPLDRAMLRCPTRDMVLVQFGRMADAAALRDAGTDGSVRDRLFDIVMRRIDVLQAHRAGMLALLSALPMQPCTALMLARLSLTSMRWLLEGAGVSAAGPTGALRTKVLLAVWLWTVRAWRTDTSEDLSATMAALDIALTRAEQTQASLLGAGPAAPAQDPSDPS